ncbi:hypothetical protein M5W83_26685 [Paenibacillus thiaminolyticus]|uniref:Uncharacterized protein n=1 Tax=Paenibacillus thiaminolyticus TaxID=49283 RepID=A0AAP9DRJ0_PANTH|nr:hypothetical protein [Paenibacillus thiaminolyticus]MCY9535527.1 hypothetical protein [Paenibacillus thiaminolyticus]MCY9601700.1 hypothetical protein [Paenibacillus thiaminolyticus]MCY9610738.1 hypothetical protein [Paenibacillus thiaminolyticus]MCY9615849.1 hypothetical protein [Paenibacillus thiaminolyticus]MCY9622147.1 hypothetical protein [Paenibacillus thiaminolyticus]
MRQFVKLDVPKLNIHAMRIPTGWSVNKNNFWEIDPCNLDPDDDIWFMFTDSLLQLHHQKKSITLDMGWRPDFLPEGNFLVVILINEDWDKPIERFESNNYIEVIEFIETKLLEITTTD